MKDDSKNESAGICCICGAFGKLTDEHIPPKASGNNKPVRLQGHEHLFDESSRKFGSTQKSNKGYVQKRLCSNCNSFFGSSYVPSFLAFSEEIKSQLMDGNPKLPVNEFRVRIRPLAIYKQILEMLVVVSNGQFDEPTKSQIKEFLLEKQSTVKPDRVSILLYNSTEVKPRFLGMHLIASPAGIRKCAQVVYPPFGFELFLGEYPENPLKLNIDSFSTFEYDQDVDVELTLGIVNENSIFGF
jgi:hypothetical protein